jgi:N-sulfoglucosamine sulfohydrolase
MPRHFLSLLLLVAAPAYAAERPNIVWIIAEDMNGWFGCYGDKTVPTPALDQMTQEGLRFDRAYMTAGVCSASRSALATGAMQTTLGIHNHRSSRQRVPEEVIRLPDGVQTIYQLMRDAGYFVTTEGMDKNDFNFLWNATELYDIEGSDRRNMKNSPRHLWRQRPQGNPFFAQVQLIGGKGNGKCMGGEPTNFATVRVMPYYPDIPEIRKEIARHYDTIRHTDQQVAEVLAALREDGLLENTHVFFWTDHGMILYRHKQWVYDASIRVPLIVRGPGIPAGSVRGDLVSGIDITATTLALAGKSLPRWFEGRNLLAPGHRPRDFVIAARDRCDYTIDRVRSVTTQRFHYLRNFLTDRPFMQPQYRDGAPFMEAARRLHQEGKLNPVQEFVWSETRVPEEFYDLENDPHEIKNLIIDPAYADEIARHRRILADWIEQTGDKGQDPESLDSLRGCFKQWKAKAVNPEFAPLR